jgi:3-oxoacyl-[acyl-carrier-protein] synthase II
VTEEGTNGNGHALITGAGAVTPLGAGVENFWDAALHAKSGIGEITLFDSSPFPSQIAGECSDFDPTDFMSKKSARRMDRFAQLGIAAGIEAAESAGIADIVRERPERVAIVMGSGIGGLSTWEREYRILHERGPGRVSPFLITMMVPNMAAGQLAIMLGATGPSQCPVLACATGAEAIAEGLELIRRGDADVVIAGSSEAPITPLSMAGFCAIRAVSRRNDDPHGASRPFDQDRDGFVMSEGAVGATEGIMCALAIKNEVVPPTINLENLAEDCEELNYVGAESREAPNLKAAISNSMGFGGHNVVVAFSKV